MGNEFPVKKLALLLVGAAALPFDTSGFIFNFLNDLEKCSEMAAHAI